MERVEPCLRLDVATSEARLLFVIRGAAFIAVFVVLQLSWQGLRGTAVEHTVVDSGIVLPAVYTINHITPLVHASAQGTSIRAPGGSLNLRNGCEGTEALFLLIAALSSAPLSWRARGMGLLYGLPLIYALNQARVLVLFYAYRANPASFDLLHGSVTPIALVLAVAGYFYAWMAYSVRSDASTPVSCSFAWLSRARSSCVWRIFSPCLFSGRRCPPLGPLSHSSTTTSSCSILRSSTTRALT